MTRNITINSFLDVRTKPRYAHNCDQCRFVGQLEEFDAYMCKDNLILRYSSEPSDYGSYGIGQLMPEYWITRKIDSYERDWNIKYFVLLRELYMNKFISVKISV